MAAQMGFNSSHIHRTLNLTNSPAVPSAAPRVIPTAISSRSSSFTPATDLQSASVSSKINSKKSSSRLSRSPLVSVSASAAGGQGSKGTIAVAGASGLIGTRLVQELIAQGYSVKVLTRNPAKARSKLPYAGLEFVAPTNWASSIAGTKAVVNLAGEPIATRWTPELKAEIKRSRVNVTEKLAAAINACPEDQRPAVLVNSSAVGYYGSSEAATFNEASSSGNDYLAEVCREWEAAANKANTRVVILRTGIILAKVQEGGALSKMIPVFQIFAGGPLGSGRQWCSWIHRDDMVGLILSAIENPSWKGSYNATAPNPVRMGELCSALGSAMGRPSFFPVPDFALKTLLGEGAQVVLEGQRVLPARAQDSGYKFKYSRVQDALRNLVN